MIDKALLFLTDFLNNELSNNFSLNHGSVVLSNLINPDGSIPENIDNKVVISIINIEHETFAKGLSNYKVDDGNMREKIAPPVYLNLYLLISANFDSGNYLEAFKRLSAVMSTLKANPYFTSNDNPNMLAPLNKLTLEIYNIPLSELSHIWSGIGAKYVPSIVYKMRMITIQDDRVKKEIPTITGLGGKPNPK